MEGIDGSFFGFADVEYRVRRFVELTEILQACGPPIPPPMSMPPDLADVAAGMAVPVIEAAVVVTMSIAMVEEDMLMSILNQREMKR